MSTNAVSSSTTEGAEHSNADALVIFGITGDLAKVMTFLSLYRLERRGLIDCPIIGVAVDDWTVDDLKKRARTSIETAGKEPVDEAIFDRLAARFDYVSGDFGKPETFTELARHLSGVRNPVFYLEVPPFLFATVIKGLSDAGLTNSARVVVEKPFGHDLQSARALAAEIHQYIDESQLYRIDHFLGKRDSPKRCTCASPTRSSSPSGIASSSPKSRSPWPRASMSPTAATSTIRSAHFATSWSTT